MKRTRLYLLSALTLTTALILPAACSDSVAGTALGADNAATMVVRLTDAPFATDSVSSVDIFVVRVDGRVASTDDQDADANIDEAGSSGWQPLASPNASYDLLDLQHGASVTLGEAPLTAGMYNGFRLIIDPTKSSVTLKNGRVLTGTSAPSVTFPSASRSGIKIVVAEPVEVVGGSTTTLLVDFDVNSSFVQRGNSIEKNGLLFKPVIKGTVVDAATVNATIRLANVTDTPLTLLLNGGALGGGSDLAFGTSSSCSSVNAAAPLLSVVPGGTTVALPGFAPTLQPGISYTLVAYPATPTGVQFATLDNTFAPAAGETGLRVFNASGGTTGLDVFVTAAGAALGTPTIANVVSGATASSFISVPAGSSQLRLTSAGSTTVLLDMASQTLTAGQNTTLVIAPPAVGSTTLRAFLVNGC